jgi:hypothetical protein
VTSQTLPLTTGRWTQVCSHPGHVAKGMKATLTVDAG